MAGKFHPRFTEAHESHRSRNEKEVKEEARAAYPTAPFFVGQYLQVVGKSRNIITVEFFGGWEEARTLRLEVVCDDPGGE